MLDYSLVTGSSAYANPDESLSDLVMGARYSSYRNLDRFLEQTNDANIGLIVWPGGTLAETRDDRFGFEYEGLQSEAFNKPNLSEIMQTAIDQEAALSVILPTVRYVGDHETLVAELNGFLTELLSGDYGALPEKMIFEVGSEYYAHFSGDGTNSAAAEYGEIADIMIAQIAAALADPNINLVGADIDIAVQAGKTLIDDEAIRAELALENLQHADMIIHHRFAYRAEGVDRRIDELETILAAWEEDAGAEAPDLFVSAWNTITLPRNEVLNMFLDENPEMDAEDVDLEGRTTTTFEDYWQSILGEAAYGQEHAVYMLESFASYAEVGMDLSAVYGFDLIHSGRLSFKGADNQHYDFAGGEMMKMIYESVGGTHVLSTDQDYSREDPVTVYAFENDDKLVVFLAAGKDAPGEVDLQMEGLGETYLEVWGDQLTTEQLEDWHAVFGIPDNEEVDESNEAEGYKLGVREAADISQSDDGIMVTLDEDFGVVRLAFAKTEAGAEEIASWSEGNELDLEVPTVIPILPSIEILADTEEEHDFGDDLALVAEATSFGGGLLFLLLLLL